MSTKPQADAIPEPKASLLPHPGYLRIAVPSWRAIGSQPKVEPVEDTPVLSREEIQALFHGELNGRVRRKSDLTVWEEQERTLAKRIRSALYPRHGSVTEH